MKDIINNMMSHTDCWPWYWLSYGEKCYAFATVEAFPANDNDPYPEPGTKLEMNENGEWIGENGIIMIIESEISNIECQNGDTICEFIAMSHAYLIGKDILTSV
jgi:hypothetical protein